MTLRDGRYEMDFEDLEKKVKESRARVLILCSPHINFAAISYEFADRSVTCTSASKTFNLAGLQISNIAIPNERLRKDLLKSIETTGVDLPNAFAATAAQTAYNDSEEWLDQFLEYLKCNLEFLKDFIKKNIRKGNRAGS